MTFREPRMSGVGVLFAINFKIIEIRKKEERFPSGQREQTVNLPAMPSKVRILPSPPLIDCGNSSVGRAQAFQAWGRGFESRFPLQLHGLVADRISEDPLWMKKASDRPKAIDCCAQVAQSVEHVLGKDEVGGSIPLLGFVKTVGSRAVRFYTRNKKLIVGQIH